MERRMLTSSCVKYILFFSIGIAKIFGNFHKKFHEEEAKEVKAIK